MSSANSSSSFSSQAASVSRSVSERFLIAERFALAMRLDRADRRSRGRDRKARDRICRTVSAIRKREKRCSSPQVLIPSCSNFCSVTAPMPQILRTGSAAMNSPHLVRLHLELPVWLVQVARDLGHQFVRPNPGRGGQFRFAKNQVADDLGERARRAGMCADIEISFIERERLDQRREAMKNSADDGRLPPINIEARSAARSISDNAAAP